MDNDELKDTWRFLLAICAIFTVVIVGVPLRKSWQMNLFCHKYHFDYAEEQDGRWACSVRIPPRDDQKGGTITLQTVDVQAVPDYELEAIDAQKERDP